MADNEFSAAALFGEEEPENNANKQSNKQNTEKQSAKAEQKKSATTSEPFARREVDKREADDDTSDNKSEQPAIGDMSDLYEMFRRDREQKNETMGDKARKKLSSVKLPHIQKDKIPFAAFIKTKIKAHNERNSVKYGQAEAVENIEPLEADGESVEEKEIITAPEKTESKPLKSLSKRAKIIMLVATALVFIMFFGFIIKQYSYSYLSHDDYGYATLSYVYWEEDMWGQNFSLSQLSHYLTEHYNRWGGRVLAFGLNILLFKAGTPVIQAFNAIVLAGIYLLAFLFAQNAKKTRLLPLAAIFTCAVFGLTGEGVALSGFYWYSASILYMVPVIYIFLGTWLMYIMMLDECEHTVSVSKLMMLPLACTLMFFGGFSLEHNGIFAVVCAGAMCVYASFKKHNPINLIYGILPFLSSVVGCHIMLMAIGNNSRRNSYSDYYSLTFGKQILYSGKNIAQTLFTSGNMMFVLLMALVTVCTASFLCKRKNRFFRILLMLDFVAAASSVAVAYGNIKTDKTAILMWVYLFLMAITVSIWLFQSKRKQDMLVWVLFLGSLASQAACLISPIFPGRCLAPFVLSFSLIASRAFNEVAEGFENASRGACIRKTSMVLVPVLVISLFGSFKVYNGFKENDAVQSFNERTLRVVSYEYENLGTAAESITLMKLKNDYYAGSTQPYGRDLIKDWMKIYYKLPDNLEYDDFIYEDYDEERLAELELELKAKEEQYFS